MRVQIILIAASLATGCDTAILTGSECSETVSKTIDVESPAEAAVQIKIDSCQLDVDACGMLCARVMADNNIGNSFGGGFGGPPGTGTSTQFQPFNKCAVTFEGSISHVQVEYSQWNGGPNCPVFDSAGDVK